MVILFEENKPTFWGISKCFTNYSKWYLVSRRDARGVVNFVAVSDNEGDAVKACRDSYNGTDLYRVERVTSNNIEFKDAFYKTIDSLNGVEVMRIQSFIEIWRA